MFICFNYISIRDVPLVLYNDNTMHICTCECYVEDHCCIDWATVSTSYLSLRSIKGRSTLVYKIFCHPFLPFIDTSPACLSSPTTQQWCLSVFSTTMRKTKYKNLCSKCQKTYPSSRKKVSVYKNLR